MITTKARYRVHRVAFLVEQEMAGALEGLNSALGLGCVKTPKLNLRIESSSRFCRLEK
jgi:hypothetical protein